MTESEHEFFGVQTSSGQSGTPLTGTAVHSLSCASCGRDAGWISADEAGAAGWLRFRGRVYCGGCWERHEQISLGIPSRIIEESEFNYGSARADLEAFVGPQRAAPASVAQIEAQVKRARADEEPGAIEELQAVLEISELGTELLIEEDDPRNAAAIRTRRLVAKALREKIDELKAEAETRRGDDYVNDTTR